MKQYEIFDPERGRPAINISSENKEAKSFRDAAFFVFFITSIIVICSMLSKCDCVSNIFENQKKFIFILVGFDLSLVIEWQLLVYHPQRPAPTIFDIIKIIILILIGIISWLIIIQFVSTEEHPFNCSLFAIGYTLTLILSSFACILTLPFLFIIICCPCICCAGIIFGMYINSVYRRGREQLSRRNSNVLIIRTFFMILLKE